ncbi:hypothetical protein COLO4_10230 [Corchorus olitorius]|uniref:Uncharacterized protein n=1 Tax=Corchorus olitorius TaxID=93759 RepID=A0A1R3K9J3_9ROSI|nr:hypothetical protein COLO4_10230 [Corchorus olitorius]
MLEAAREDHREASTNAKLSVMCSLVDNLRNWFCIAVGGCIVCHKSSFPVILPPIASA